MTLCMSWTFAVAQCGLNTAEVAAKFFAKYKVPPRQAGAVKVREFIATLESVLSETP
jgi:hypothetical protein